MDENYLLGGLSKCSERYTDSNTFQLSLNFIQTNSEIGYVKFGFETFNRSEGSVEEAESRKKHGF